MKQYNKALDDQNEYIKRSPISYAAEYGIRSTLHEELGMYKEALADREKVLQLDPDDPWASKNIERLRTELEKATKSSSSTKPK